MNFTGQQIEVATACIEASREHGQLHLCRQLLGCLPCRPADATNEINALYDQLDSLAARVDAAQFLANHGTELNLSEVRRVHHYYYLIILYMIIIDSYDFFFRITDG